MKTTQTILVALSITLLFVAVIYMANKINRAENEFNTKWEQMSEKEQCLWNVGNTLSTTKKLEVIKTCNEIYE